MNLLQHRCPLLQPKHDILLHQRKLDVVRQDLQLRELLVRLAQQRLLILFPAQREEGFRFVILAKAFARDLGLAAGYDSNLALVLMQFVALDFEVEDRSGCLTNRISIGADSVRKY